MGNGSNLVLLAYSYQRGKIQAAQVFSEIEGIQRADCRACNIFWRLHYLVLGPFHNGGIGAAGKRSEEHTSELQSLMRISYAVFCLKKKKSYLIYNTIIICVN